MSKELTNKANQELADVLKEEYGMEIVPYDGGELLANPGSMIPVPSDVAAHLSVVTSAIPTLTANAITHEALGKTAYSITFNGKDVLPDQLWQKKNGSYISNLKGDGSSWGKQTDIRAIDNTAAQGAAVASSVFAVAAVATSMYYMKNIDDKPASLQATTKQILEFLENDKQSQVEADMEILKDIAENIDSIKDNDTLKSVKIEQFSALQREAKRNIRFYEKQIRSSLESYIAKKKKDKKEQPPLEQLRKNYLYYRICLQEYALSKLIEIQLTDTYEKSQLSRIRTEIDDLSSKHKNLISQLLTDIYGHHLGSLGAKALKGLSNSFDFMGGVIEKTPLGKTELDEALIHLGEQTGKISKNRAKRDADRIVTRSDYGVIDPVVQNVKMMEATYHEPIELVSDGEETFIRLKTA